jgi:hypothetical protein
MNGENEVNFYRPNGHHSNLPKLCACKNLVAHNLAVDCFAIVSAFQLVRPPTVMASDCLSSISNKVTV